MTKKDMTSFVEMVSTTLKFHFKKQCKIEVAPVLKNNTTLTGLIIKDENINISPVFYLEDYYKDYLNGTEIVDICDCIINCYNKNKKTASFKITDFNKVKEFIYNLFILVVTSDTH